MVKAADKLGKMLACSSQEEAAHLWEKYEQGDGHYNATVPLKNVADDQSASSYAISSSNTTIRKKETINSKTKSNYSTSLDQSLLA